MVNGKLPCSSNIQETCGGWYWSMATTLAPISYPVKNKIRVRSSTPFKRRQSFYLIRLNKTTPHPLNPLTVGVRELPVYSFKVNFWMFKAHYQEYLDAAAAIKSRNGEEYRSWSEIPRPQCIHSDPEGWCGPSTEQKSGSPDNQLLHHFSLKINLSLKTTQVRKGSRKSSVSYLRVHGTAAAVAVNPPNTVMVVINNTIEAI